MKYKNEIQILNIVKFIPPLFILLLSAITLTVIYLEHQRNFSSEKARIEQEFIQHNKQIIKNQVNTVHNFIVNQQKNTFDQLRKTLSHEVEEAYAIAHHIYKSNPHLSKEAITKQIKSALYKLRPFDHRGYYFIYDMKGTNILHPLKPSVEGTNLWNYQSPNGNYIVQEAIGKLHNKNESFYEWEWFKHADESKLYKKCGFIKRFEPYDWFIGTAEYVDEFEKIMQKRILEEVKSFKYEKSGYVFIFHKSGTYLSHPRKGSLGKNVYDTKNIIDKEGKVAVNELFTKMVNLAQEGGGFVSYIQAKKPSSQKPAAKIAYVKAVNEWDWVIGKGFYIDEINVAINAKKLQMEEEFQNYLQKIITATVVLLVFLLLISLFFSRTIELKFRAYKDEIRNYLKENTKQQNMLAQQSKMAAMGEMIGNIAHQWRQPLSIISTATTGLKLQHELKTLDEKEMIETLDTINKSVQHLSMTIDDFRDFFKPHKDRTEFELKTMIERSIQLISAQFITKEIHIEKELEDINIYGYERELLQVLINILNNAKDALLSKKKNRYLFIKAYIKKSEAVIQIKDNAGGIQDDIINKIFEPYFTTKHQSQGTGIGLYMSKEIVEKHMQGTILVENEQFVHKSKKYTGAVFTIYLPLKKKEL